MIIKPSYNSIRSFLRTGLRLVKAPDKRVFLFALKSDPMTRMQYIAVKSEQQAVGHFDFDLKKDWMNVQYGSFATSPSDTYTEWSSSCLKDPAIEVYLDWRKIYRGIGRSMVALSLQWGKSQDLCGMRIIDPRTPKLWENLNFVHRVPDQVFIFDNMRIPRCGIHLRKQLKML